MDISIIICTCNRSKKLSTTLESLQKASISEGLNCEVIVVDNNSKDATKRVVENFVGMTPLTIKYFFEGQRGKSFALNTGVKVAKGKVVAFTDDDIIVDQNWLLAIINATKKYKNYNCFGGRIIPLWQSLPPPWLGTCKPYNALRGTVFERDDGDKDREYGECTISGTPCGANMFFRREVIDANGAFRTDLGPVGGVPGASEDTEFCLRMGERGEKFMYIADVIVYHSVEANKISKTSLQRWRYYCARSQVRACGIPNHITCYFNVPRYLFKQLFESFIRWNLSINSKQRFYQRLKFCWTLGEIVETYKIKKSTCDAQPSLGLKGE